MPKNNSAPAPSETLSIIAKGTVIDGTINATSAIRINGKIIGQLQVGGRVVIAQTGSVEGTIVADESSISGTVEGDLVIKGKTTFSGTAKVNGTVRTSRLVIEEGAVFNGECQMGEPSQAVKSGFVPQRAGDGNKKQARKNAAA